MFESFIKDKLHIDDVVVYLKNVRTGSSTIRKCKFIGKITGFTELKVKINRFSKPDQWVTPNMIRDYGQDEVYPEEVICIIISKSERDVNAENTTSQD